MLAARAPRDPEMNEPPQFPSDIELLDDVLMELLNTSRITAELLETSIRLHPELLGPDAQRWLSILAQAQDTPEARAKVSDLARILRRLQTESLEAVFSDEASRSRLRAARHAREARLQAAREKLLAKRKEPRAESAAPGPSPCSPSSLAGIVAPLRAISGLERPQSYGRDVLNPQAKSDSIPAYLFRGESGIFESAYSSRARLSASVRALDLDARALQDVDRISDRLVVALGEKCGLTPPQALAYLQHYGYPTDYIDVTSDVSVAASFASKLRVGDAGAVCIVPTERLLARGSLIDLRHHPLAERPRLQSAFAVHIPEYPNLRDPAAIEALQLTWIEFRFTDLDAARFVPDFALLDARSDRVAGLIWLLIDDCAKFSDKAAKLLSKRIEPAPVFSVIGHDGRMVLVSEDDVVPEEATSDEDFRRAQYEFWSDAFPTPERQPLPPELESTLTRAADLKPGEIVRILSSNAFRRAAKSQPSMLP
jgi:hypothetical protein